MKLIRLNFDVDLLPVEQPHQKQPQQDERDRVEQRGIDRCGP